MSFTPIPAIDILDGSCVRLERGDYDKATTYASDPAAVARDFVAAGARRLHLVDLDGARAGRPVNSVAIDSAVKAAKDQADVAVQLGGGLRTIDSVAQALDSGVDYAIVGTAAIRDPGFLAQACRRFPERIILGLDARDGKLALSGWTEKSEIDAAEFARQAQDSGIAGVIHTDIDRDGVLAGPNTAATAGLADELDCPVYASGGVSGLADLDQLRQTSIAGAIVGKALYCGSIRIEDLFAAAASVAP